MRPGLLPTRYTAYAAYSGEHGWPCSLSNSLCALDHGPPMALHSAACLGMPVPGRVGHSELAQTMIRCFNTIDGKRIYESLKSRRQKSIPHVLMSHQFVERWIGSVRRELLDQNLFWTATDLENKLRCYKDYYDEYRCHSSRDCTTPIESGGANVVDISSYRWQTRCRGLFHLPAAA